MSTFPPRAVIFVILSSDLDAIFLGSKRLKLPPDAEISAWWRDLEWRDSVHSGSVLCLCVTHGSFEPIEAGRKIPRRAAELVDVRKTAGVKIARKKAANG